MPELPAVSRTAGLKAATLDVFAPGGALARVVEEFEPRPGQQQMAAHVADTLAGRGVLLAEAGTGTGKTLAYLVPAILSRTRVLVSTGTKNLQEQIYFKDLPLLREALGIPFTATYMKGRANYLCLHRWEQYRDGVTHGTPLGPAKAGPHDTTAPSYVGAGFSRPTTRMPDLSDRVLLPVIQQWLETSETGDRAELSDLPEDLPLWNELAATADTCLGAECPKFGDCFVTKMRQKAAESDIVIVNHHLLCADASVRRGAYGEVIPACRHVVLDEAHQLEDVATQYFGVAVSNYRVEELARDSGRILAAAGLRQEADDIRAALERADQRARALFAALALHAASGPAKAGPYETRSEGRSSGPASAGPHETRGEGRSWGPALAGPRTEARARYTSESLADVYEEALLLIGALDAVEAAVKLLKVEPAADGTAPAWAEDVASIARRAAEIRDELRFLVRAGDPAYVYYLETRGRGVFLRASPIDVSQIVRELLLDRMDAVVLTSATLTVDGSFDYVRTRLGIDHAIELRVASEFDYTRQAILYLPRRMPPPKAPNFAEAAAREVIEILRRTEGRAFVLFTSYAVLRTVQAIAEMALDYPMFVQGTAPRSVLLRQFRTTPNAVLLATSSFWQGVDVVGDALSCVIIDKLPFASPGDPITSARIEAINQAGGNAFADYQIPLAILSLQQGLGRLIRHRHDRGVLAILDPRLRTMGYGHRFLQSLPPAPVTLHLDDISRFFEK